MVFPETSSPQESSSVNSVVEVGRQPGPDGALLAPETHGLGR